MQCTAPCLYRKDILGFHMESALGSFWNHPIFGNIRIRIRIKLYFTLVLKTINISFKLSVTNGNNKKKHTTIKFISKITV